MERPKSIVVFGVLNIVFGALGLCGGLFAIAIQFGLTNPQGSPNPALEIMQSNPLYELWMQIGLVLGFVATGALIAAGIGLLKNRPWARVTSVSAWPSPRSCADSMG
jgi:hypothetical protein